MPKRTKSVIPFRRNDPASEADELVADIAYTLWLSSPFWCGPPEEAFMTALRLVRGKSAPLLFLVPKRIQHHHPRPIITMMGRPSGGEQGITGGALAAVALAFSLALHLHQVDRRTCTSKLLNMPSTQLYDFVMRGSTKRKKTTHGSN